MLQGKILLLDLLENLRHLIFGILQKLGFLTQKMPVFLGQTGQRLHFRSELIDEDADFRELTPQRNIILRPFGTVRLGLGSHLAQLVFKIEAPLFDPFHPLIDGGQPVVQKRDILLSRTPP
jgi:hypothetical protein